MHQRPDKFVLLKTASAKPCELCDVSRSREAFRILGAVKNRVAGP